MTATADKPVEFLPPSIQQQLGLRDPRFRPFSDVKTVLRDLGEFEMDVQQVRELVESRFLIGFNIGVGDTAKVELRVLTKSIEHFRATGGKKYHELEWPQIFRLVVPHKKPVVTGLEVRRSLLCDRGHVENLILNGRLTAVKKAQCGPGGSWVISRDSFENFLRGRMQ
jgi:hypothetical protein